MGWIYKITNPTGRIYIGQTVSLARRVSDYRFKKKRFNTIVFNSINKYGWEAHTFEVVEEVENNLLSERERFWIKELDTYVGINRNGMNMTIGGEGHCGTWMHDVERRKRQAVVFSGEGNPFYGKKHSDSVRKVIAKLTSERNKRMGITVPKHGAEKGRLKVIKSVVVYDTLGRFVSEYCSITEAAKCLQVNHTCVSESVKHHHFIDGKYTFRYKTDNYPLEIHIGKVDIKQEKRPVVWFFNNYKIRYPSAFEASIETGVPKGTINRAALSMAGRPIRRGHIFCYEDLLEKYNLA